MKTFLTLCLAPAALAAFVRISVPITFRDEDCTQGNGYCGLNLLAMGYQAQDLPNYSDQAIYYCDNIDNPDYVKTCGGICDGPIAHCA